MFVLRSRNNRFILQEIMKTVSANPITLIRDFDVSVLKQVVVNIIGMIKKSAEMRQMQSATFNIS